MQNRPELLLSDVPLSELVVVDEELAESKSVLLDHLLDLLHEGLDLLGAGEVEVGLHVGGLGARGGAVDRVFEHLSVVDEVQVLNVILLVSVNQHDGLQFPVAQVEAEPSQHLLELLGRNLEVLVSVEVLEE